MFNKIKEVWDDIQEWWADRSPLEHTNGEEIMNAFFAGSGQYTWCYIIFIGLYCLITKQRLGFVKK